MNLVEMIVLFWLVVFFITGVYLGIKSYKRKKNLHKLFDNK